MEATTAPEPKVTKTAKTPEPTPEEQGKITDTKLVESHFPERWGYTRKIHWIFPQHFRINYHDDEKGNKITYTSFVTVMKDKKIKVEFDEYCGHGRWKHHVEIW
jgi:hypothetical protein